MRRAQSCGVRLIVTTYIRHQLAGLPVISIITRRPCRQIDLRCRRVLTAADLTARPRRVRGGAQAIPPAIRIENAAMNSTAAEFDAGQTTFHNERSAELVPNQVIHGDCTKVLQTLPSNSVDLVVTDPPYFVRYRDRLGRTIANDSDPESVLGAFVDLYRVLRPNTFCVSFYGWSRVAAFFRAWSEAGFRATSCGIRATRRAADSCVLIMSKRISWPRALQRRRMIRLKTSGPGSTPATECIRPRRPSAFCSRSSSLSRGPKRLCLTRSRAAVVRSWPRPFVGGNISASSSRMDIAGTHAAGSWESE